MEPFIAESARKWRVADADMLHAYRNSIRTFDVGDGMTMFIGPNPTAHQLLEIGVVEGVDGEVIVHAMKARPKFLR